MANDEAVVKFQFYDSPIKSRPALRKTNNEKYVSIL